MPREGSETASKFNRENYLNAIEKSACSLVGRPRENTHRLTSWETEKMRDTYSTWLNRFPWEVFHTGTFKGHPESLKGGYLDAINVKRKFEVTYMNQLNKILYAKKELKRGEGVAYYMVVEPHKTGLLHEHALMLGLRGMSEKDVESIWFEALDFGYCRGEKYNPIDGAAYYLTKYVTKGIYDYALSRNLGKWIDTERL
jgi:hypothetical protein